MKKLIWTALVTTVAAAAAAAAIRGLRYAWTKVFEEQPPETPWWAKLSVGGPLRKRILDGIEPTSRGVSG